ncbi:MAG: ATP-binding protein [Oligoflexia bacterium]|nr:ATP-binding protein [Oligoflexia bacterium]
MKNGVQKGTTVVNKIQKAIKYNRLLDLKKMLKRKSHFLLGPRMTGKSWLIKETVSADALVFDLLDDDVYLRLLKRPRQLGEEIDQYDKQNGKNSLVVIDEIQKLPALLDEVHRLIEKKSKKFLLTGSSARKLKRGGANLLAGRARSAYLFPLTSLEIPQFDLEVYLNCGGLPSIYNAEDAWDNLRDYVNTYLKEEIQAEAIVRRIDHFAHFIDVIGLSSGKELNISSIASDSGVPARTVSEFILVLKDTLLAFELEPFRKSIIRKATTKSKLYLFDVGVANFLARRRNVLPKSDAFGDCFEHYVIQEIKAILSYGGSDEVLSYWRSKDFEVDLIIGNKYAIEIKSTEQVQERHLKGLRALREEKQIESYHVVSRDPIRRKIDFVEVWHINDFIRFLYNRLGCCL